MKKTKFIKNALILTASSLILRFAGIVFKVWAASLIGSEGIGLYQLVFSVYILVATFASSGISTAVTRLLAEELVLGKNKSVNKILLRSIELTLIIAIISAATVYFGAEYIAIHMLEDARAIPALKIMPFSLPFMGVTSCLHGYFIARRKITPNAVSQLFEQTIRIVLVVVLLKRFAAKGLAFCCSVILFGDVAAEALGCIMLWINFICDRNKLKLLNGREKLPYVIIRKILHISLPITSGRYLNTALRTAENLLVPKNLAKYKFNGENALSQFGMIKGMALPILFFPSTLLNSISTLLIPEIAEAVATNRKGLVRSATKNILKLTAVISFVFAAIFFTAGKQIGLLIYKSEDVGNLLKALSPIVPLMYLDSISDGILKGLDQQFFSFRTSVSDSVIRIIFILLLLPQLGLNGFIIIMYASNLLTCLLNICRLIKISKAKLNLLSEIVLPLVSALCIVLLTNAGLSIFMKTDGLVYIIFECIISMPLYILLLFLFGTITKEDILNVIR